MYKYVVFDFDGTLVQSKFLAVKLFNDFSEKYGYQKMKADQVDYLATVSIKERLKMLGCPLYKLPMLLMDMKKKYKQEVVTLHSVSGIQDVLQGLKRDGVNIGILSSNHAENIYNFLNRNNLKMFDFVFTASNLFGKDKALLQLMKDKGISNSELLYVGDEVRDVEACKKRKVDCAAVTWGYDAEELLAKGSPQYIIRQPGDIKTILGSVPG